MEYLILTTYEHEPVYAGDEPTYSYDVESKTATFPDGVLVRAKAKWKKLDVCQVQVFKIADKWDVESEDDEPESELEQLRRHNQQLQKQAEGYVAMMGVVKDITGVDPREYEPEPSRDSRSLIPRTARANDVDIAANLLREAVRTKGESK